MRNIHYWVRMGCDQVPFILHGITGNDDHTNNKYKQLQQALNKSGSALKQAKPTEEEKLDRNCFYTVHILQYYALYCATNTVANTKNMPSGIYKTDCQVNTKDNSKFDVERINAIFSGESIVDDDPGGTGSRGTAPRGTRLVAATARPYPERRRADNIIIS